MMTTATDNPEDDLLDLDLSHEAEQNTTTTNNDGSTTLYPAMMSIDDTVLQENEPMLGQFSPTGSTNNKIDSNQIGVTVTATNPSVNTTTNTISAPNDTSNTNKNTVVKSVKCWQIEYYQPYFNVDTLSLLTRLKKTILPLAPLLDTDLNEEPDLYGPFWIVSTLVFLMAAMGNLSRFLHREKSTSEEWESDIKKISEAASLLYSVSAIVPLILYFLYRNWSCERGFIELIAIYGYSLFPFVPACILCVVPWSLVQWSVVITALVLSLWFLTKNLYMPLDEEKRKKPGYYVLGVAMLVQFAIGLALKVYFFEF